MTAFIQEGLRVARIADALDRLPSEQIEEKIREYKRNAEANSRFKKGQLVRVCRPGALSLVTWQTVPHDHNDPNEHFVSRVTGWDAFGRINVAVPAGSSCEWCWSEDMLEPFTGKDWALSSKFKPGQKVHFTWEDRDFYELKAGSSVEAVLEIAHIGAGDWIISYDPGGRRNRRVLNEKDMRI